jgi:hypothetical protein
LGSGDQGSVSDRSRQLKEACRVFLFFSNRLGCMGSLLLYVAVTIVLIAILKLA